MVTRLRPTKPLEASPASKRAASVRGADMAAMVRLVELVERVAACQGADAYFSETEVSAWPADLVAALRAMCLLTHASPANSIECPGCEEACVMPVHVIPATASLPSRALIGCDKRDDIGRVSVTIGSLARLKSSGPMLAEALAKLLFFDLARPTQIDAHRWQLGQFEGLTHKSPLVLSLDTAPMLAVAGHHIKLADVLRFKRDAVILDQPALRKLVDSPTRRSSEGDEKPEDKANRIRVRIKELKAQNVRAFQATVAKEEKVSVARIKQILAAHPENAPASWTTGLGSAKTSTSSKKSKP